MNRNHTQKSVYRTIANHELNKIYWLRSTQNQYMMKVKIKHHEKSSLHFSQEWGSMLICTSCKPCPRVKNLAPWLGLTMPKQPFSQSNLCLEASFLQEVAGLLERAKRFSAPLLRLQHSPMPTPTARRQARNSFLQDNQDNILVHKGLKIEFEGIKKGTKYNNDLQGEE